MLSFELIGILSFIYLKEDALTLLRKTTSFLKTANSSLTKELQVGTEINLNIVTGLGNILAASSKDMDINSEHENAHIDKNKVRCLD